MEKVRIKLNLPEVSPADIPTNNILREWRSNHNGKVFDAEINVNGDYVLCPCPEVSQLLIDMTEADPISQSYKGFVIKKSQAQLYTPLLIIQKRLNEKIRD